MRNVNKLIDIHEQQKQLSREKVEILNKENERRNELERQESLRIKKQRAYNEMLKERNKEHYIQRTEEYFR